MRYCFILVLVLGLSIVADRFAPLQAQDKPSASSAPSPASDPSVDSKPSPSSKPSTDAKPRFRYRMERAAEPTEEQQKAYERIEAAMDKAVKFYNENTVTIRKSLTVKYSPGTPTADGSNNGTIRIGKNAMKPYVCMHEIAHTVGIGTSPKWNKLVVDHVFTGEHATAMLRELTGNPNAVLHADRMHFWPYGLNQPREAKTDEDLIRHCKMVEAICKDLREAGKK